MRTFCHNKDHIKQRLIYSPKVVFGLGRNSKKQVSGNISFKANSNPFRKNVNQTKLTYKAKIYKEI